MRRMRVGIFGAVVAAALILTGCAAGPKPTQAPTPSASDVAPTATPSESAPSAEPSATVVALVARPTELELRSEAGEVLERLEYRGDFDSTLAELERVLGPVESSEEARGSSHFPPSTAHRWGGLEIWEQRYVDRWEMYADDERTLGMPSFRVRFAGPEAAGVRLETTSGVAAGAAWTELDQLPELQTNPSGCSGPYTDFLDKPAVNPDGEAYVSRTSVDFQQSDDGLTIAAVRAPIAVTPGCA